MKPEHIAIIKRAMDNARGDDMERAQHAFGRMTDAQLDQEYGSSGQTCRQILEGYRQHRQQHNEAARDLDDLLRKEASA
jgi:hypothetical protein